MLLQKRTADPKPKTFGRLSSQTDNGELFRIDPHVALDEELALMAGDQLQPVTQAAVLQLFSQQGKPIIRVVDIVLGRAVPAALLFFFEKITVIHQREGRQFE